MDFAWTFWTGKPSRKTKSGPVLILQNKKSSISKYSTYHSWFTLRNCEFFFFSKYLLPFLQHICHVATAILTDTEGSGCHFWVLFGDRAPTGLSAFSDECLQVSFAETAYSCHLGLCLSESTTQLFIKLLSRPMYLQLYHVIQNCCNRTL